MDGFLSHSFVLLMTCLREAIRPTCFLIHVEQERKKSFIALFLAMLGLGCCRGFSLAVASGSYSGVGEQASHCGGFSCFRAQTLGHSLNGCGTWAELLLGCEFSLDQGSNPCLLHWQADFFTTEPPGKPQEKLL